MKLPNNTFTHALREGNKQVGLWVTLSNNYAAKIVAYAGFDWVVLDMEHSPNDLRTVMSQLDAFSDSPTTTLVRPEWNDPVLVKRLLDTGASGLVFPMIQSVEEAEAAVASTRYPPRGIRGVSGSTRANKFGRIDDYFQRIEEETTVIIQLETQESIAMAEDIGAVDGVSGIFFGPADIAADMGMLGQPMDSKVWDLIMPVAKKLIEKGVPVGTLVMDQEFSVKLLNEGFTFVACGTDASLLAKGADLLCRNVKGGIE